VNGVVELEPFRLGAVHAATGRHCVTRRYGGHVASNRLMETARPTRQFVRYIVAILIAILAGLMVQVLAAAFIDGVLGYEVGGRWSLNVQNAIVIFLHGAAVGCVAGAIAKKRGVLISAIAAVIWDIFDPPPELWAWIEVIPAMICGHFSTKIARQV